MYIYWISLLLLLKILQISAFTAELATISGADYTYYPINGNTLRFQILAPHNAHLVLSPKPWNTTSTIEIILGGWGNTKSVVRNYRSETNLCSTGNDSHSSNLLHKTKFRTILLHWGNGKLSVFRTNLESQVIKCNYPEERSFTYVGVRTAWGANGFWRLWNMDRDTENLAAGARSIHWTSTSSGNVPSGAFVGNKQSGSYTMYVARTTFSNGALIPGKSLESKPHAYFPLHGEEYRFRQYEILCNFTGLWKRTRFEIPSKALPAGIALDGEALYVGRVEHEYTVTIGKVHVSNNYRLYIPYGGKEISYVDYEILCYI